MADAAPHPREVFDLKGFVEQVEALDNKVPTEAQTAMYLEFRRLLDRAMRWFVSSRPASMDIGAEIAPGVPWCVARDAAGPLAVALKSGNFGGPDFFAEALAAAE